MYFNGTILTKKKDKIELMEEACESANVRHQFKEEHTLRDKYFPYMESFLPKSERVFFRYIAKYEDKFSSILNTPYLTDFPKFGPEDRAIVFKCTQIDESELYKDIRKVPLPGDLKEKSTFEPLQVALLLMVRYYMATKQKEKLKIVYYYIGYSIYWKRYVKQFQKHGFKPKPETMIYTINNLNFKFIIKQTGSLKEFLLYIVQNVAENYIEQILDCTDEDIWYVLDQIATSLRNKVVQIASEYYKNYNNNEVLLKSVSSLDDDGTQRLDTSVTAEVESLAQQYTSDFFMSPINVKRVARAASMAKDASVNELKVSLEKIITDASIEEVHSFYASLFYIFLASDDPKANVNAIKSLKFLTVMRDVFKKGNSTDKNIIKTRDMMNKWLENGSNTYRVTNREATKTGYRRAIYYYFILSVTNNK